MMIIIYRRERRRLHRELRSSENVDRRSRQVSGADFRHRLLHLSAGEPDVDFREHSQAHRQSDSRLFHKEYVRRRGWPADSPQQVGREACRGSKPEPESLTMISRSQFSHRATETRTAFSGSERLPWTMAFATASRTARPILSTASQQAVRSMVAVISATASSRRLGSDGITSSRLSAGFWTCLLQEAMRLTPGLIADSYPIVIEVAFQPPTGQAGAAAVL